MLRFVRRHTSVSSSIKRIRREEIPQYSPMLLREAVMNALIHADYANHRAPIQIAIFDCLDISAFSFFYSFTIDSLNFIFEKSLS